MTTHTVTTSDPIDLAHSHLTAATINGDKARQARDLDTPEGHRLAGRFREEQRFHLKRAEIHAHMATAEAMRTIADALSRIALTQ